MACVAREPFPWSGFPKPPSYAEEEAKAILEAMERATERARPFVPPFVILGNEYSTLSSRHVANFWERNVVSETEPNCTRRDEQPCEHRSDEVTSP
jgi:hypothetical protein